jgi:myo-inositol-1(or 4)-monophosphatase
MSTKYSELDSYLRVAFKACDGAREILDQHFGNLRNLDEKFQAGLVSDADRESEKFIFNTILEAFPDHSILGEESGLGGAKNGRALWMIDPLDGTTNFVHRLPFFCISIGLELDGELVLGLVEAPKLGWRYHAVKGGGAFLNGQPIHASPRSAVKDLLFATGFSSRDECLDKQMKLATWAITETRGLRRAGAAALDLCMVAEGIFDCFWEKNLSPWDMAAGVVIAREAGCVASDMSGRPFDPRDGTIVCGTKLACSELLKRIQAAPSIP